MGSSPGPAAAAVADRESSQLVGLGFPQPTVEPAEDRAVAGRDDAHHGPTAGALAAQPAGRLGSPRLALGCEDARWQDCALRGAARATSSGAASPAGPLAAATLARRPSGERAGGGRRPARRSRRGTPFAARRANVLFVLGLISACALFLAATTKTDSVVLRVRGDVRSHVLLRLRARTTSPARAGRRAGRADRRASRSPDAPDAPRRAAAAPCPAAGAAPAHQRSDDGPPSPSLLARRLIPRSFAAPAPPHRYTRARWGCSSVGRAQQSHC